VRLRDGLRLALRDVTRRLGRCLLTILAVALAATLLTALLIIATTAKTRVIGQLTKGGPLATIRVEGSNLDDAALRRIGALRGVRGVSAVVVAKEVIVPPDPPTYVPPSTRGAAASPADPSDQGVRPFVDGVVGIDLANPDLFPLSVSAGRLPAASSATEVAVTRTYLEDVGVDPNEPARVLGTQLELAAPRFVGTDADDVWGRRKLAYEIDHKAEGFYHLLLLSSAPDILDEITRVLRITDGVLRHLAVRRVKSAAAPQPEAVTEEPEPVAEQPEAVAQEPEPVAKEPEPVAAEPEPEAVHEAG
jgi:hypothetical protein